jgi:hypothetical protein
MSTFSTCTSTTRPGSPTDGDVLFETDTKNVIIWDGTNWRGYRNDGIVGWTGSSSYSVAFDGTGDYFEAGSGINTFLSSIGTGEVSISMWFKLNASEDTLGTLFWLGNSAAASDYFFCRYSSGVIQFQSRVGSSGIAIDTSPSVSKDQWYHICLVRSGTGASSKGEIYLNGTGTGGTTNAEFGVDFSTISSSMFKVGRGINTSNDLYGWIDDVAVFDYALNQTQINTLRGGVSTGTLGSPANISSLNPKIWYLCGDSTTGQGSTVTDIGSETIDATLAANSSFSTDTP